MVSSVEDIDESRCIVMIGKAIEKEPIIPQQLLAEILCSIDTFSFKIMEPTIGTSRKIVILRIDVFVSVHKYFDC